MNRFVPDLYQSRERLFAGIPRCGTVDIEFKGGRLGPNGWFTKNIVWNKRTGITVYYDAPDPPETGLYYQAEYRAHWLGASPAWGKYEYDDDDCGAGNDKNQIHLIELTIAP